MATGLNRWEGQAGQAAGSSYREIWAWESTPNPDLMFLQPEAFSLDSVPGEVRFEGCYPAGAC